MTLGTERVVSLECGHAYVEKIVLKASPAEIVSSDGRRLFPFQVKSVEFAEESNVRCLIGHEMGLGKTVIECALIKRNEDMLTPCLIVCKSGLKLQLFAEIYRWTGLHSQVIENAREKPYNFPVTIVSIDTVARLKWDDDDWAQFKHLCIDECQLIKNPDSQRTKAVRKAAQRIPYITALSGTAIKNNAGEYFPILNILRPEIFPSFANYLVYDCQTDGNKVRGLKNPDAFRKKTQDFIIRYERKEVMPELPSIFRQFRLAEMSKGDVDAYTAVVKEFNQYIEDLEGKIGAMQFTNLLAFFSKMRKITGVAKVNEACDFLQEFLQETDRKIVVFLHHKLTAQMMMLKMGQICDELGINKPLLLSSDLSSEQRMEVVETFKKDGWRIMIASTLASGEGLNLQFCSDCMMMERQWNPANEEQAEARFPRPGSTADRINVTYLIAAGTIDEFLTELVEKKREIMQSVLDGRTSAIDETSLMRELAEVINTRGLKRWSYK
jgi:SNF2 family DNA or RNA helicase